MNSGMRSGIRLLIAFMSLAFVFSVFLVSTPSPVVADSANWTYILKSGSTPNINMWDPEPWVWYTSGQAPAMAACTAGNGRVVALSAGWAIRNGANYVQPSNIEELLDVTFRWLASPTGAKARSLIKILWYEGYGVFDQNYKSSCTELVTWLVNKGYDTNNIVVTEDPIALISLDQYDILMLPQLQLGLEALGGENRLIPTADYTAMSNFVKVSGKGLLVLEGGDYSGSGPTGHNYYRVSGALVNNIETGMYFQPDQIRDGSNYKISFNVLAGHWIGDTYRSEYGTTCVISTACSLTTTPEPSRAGIAVDLSESFKYGAPGETLSYTVTVVNGGTVTDSYTLSATSSIWGTAELSTYRLTNVAPGISCTVSLTITIPTSKSRAAPPSPTVITVTATSDFNSSVKRSIKGSAHVAPLPVNPQLGSWKLVQNSPRLMNYGTGVWAAGENIYILNNYTSIYGTPSDVTTYTKGEYFMCYNTSTGYWYDLAYPKITLKNAAHNMCWDHGNYIYAVPGGAYSDAQRKVVYLFCRYNIATNTWEFLPRTPMWQGPGDSLVWVQSGANEYIYAWLGTTSNGGGGGMAAELWRFNISTMSWDSNFLKHVRGYTAYGQVADSEQRDNGYGADDGCNLVWTGGDNIYFTPGSYNETLPKDQERIFLRYSIQGNTFTPLASPPDTGNGGIDDCGSMVYPGSGDYIYVIKGGDDAPQGGGSTPSVIFWRYKISNNIWETLTPLSYGVGDVNGCRIGYAGGGKIYYWVGPNNAVSGGSSNRGLYVYGTEAAGVDVSAPQSENSAASGKIVTFNVTVKNTGTVSDTFDLTVSDNAVPTWSPSILPTSITLGAGASGIATLSVTIPAGTADGASDRITVTATSQADTSVKDNVSCIARCENPPGVEVYISPSSKSGQPGSTLTYTVTVKNTSVTPSSTTYSLTTADNASPSWSRTISPTSLTVPAGENRTATLSVTIHSSAQNGASDTVRVTATGGGVSAQNSCIATVSSRGVEVSISPTDNIGLLGSTLTFTVTVTNTGIVSATYTLGSTDNAGWNRTISPTPLTVPVGENRTATLSVTIPSSAAEGMSDRVTVTATSQSDATMKDNASCVVRAIERIRREVLVAISPSSQSGDHGASLTYTVTVTNTGNVTDDYNLSKTDNRGWNLTLPSSVAAVTPGEDRRVTLTVEIPDNAANGDSSTITVTATSSENTEVEDSASCTAYYVEFVADVTSLTISPSRFPLFPGYSWQVQSLTATLRAGNNPLANKTITWSATAGSVSLSSGTTDAFGQVSIVYTAPAVTDNTPQVTITASFDGDNLYQASSGTSLGIPAVRIIVTISPAGGTVVVYVIELDVTVNLLVVPQNALSESTDITVSQAPSESISNYKMASHIFNVGPSGTTFAHSSTITLPYDESELPVGVGEGDLAIYRRTSAGGSWERVGGIVNTTANTVSVPIDHLSEYAVMSGLGGGGLPLFTIGVIVAVILIIAVIAIFIRRR